LGWAEEVGALDVPHGLGEVLIGEAPVFRAVVTVHLPDARVQELFGGGEMSAIDEGSCRLSTLADTVEWLASRLIRLGGEFEMHSPPQLTDYLAMLAGRPAATSS
jgi:hypothetical protein